MIAHHLLSDHQLRQQIRSKTLTLAGNDRLKIFGTFACAAGKRLKKSNRVFFANLQDALANGFRPCGHCQRKAYHLWKKNNGSI
jgi:methylphosphotriester-DNA--protein-cysteine methyltransferase